MTAFNRQQYIEEAIESVLLQTYSNWELIIVDDCSTDNTVAIARSFEIKDSRIKVFINEKNLGDYLNRNKAASFAKGEFLKYLDADDIMYSSCLESMLSCMQQFPEAAYGLIASNKLKLLDHSPSIYKPKQAYATYFFKDPILIIGPTGSIIRTKYFNEINGFSGTPYIGDTELWLKLSMNWPMVVMPPDLIWWRTHDEQQSKYESKYGHATKMRYDMIINSLSNVNCPIKGDWANIAIRNHKSIRVRQLLFKTFKNLNFLELLKKINEFNFKFMDILLALKKNKNPLLKRDFKSYMVCAYFMF